MTTQSGRSNNVPLGWVGKIGAMPIGYAGDERERQGQREETFCRMDGVVKGNGVDKGMGREGGGGRASKVAYWLTVANIDIKHHREYTIERGRN